jgi:hypothetical protein
MCGAHYIHFSYVGHTSYTLRVWGTLHTLFICRAHFIHFTCVGHTSYTLHVWGTLHTLYMCGAHFIHFTYVGHTSYTLHVWGTLHTLYVLINNLKSSTDNIKFSKNIVNCFIHIAHCYGNFSFLQIFLPELVREAC